MTMLDWNTEGSSRYESGLDRGVLYTMDGMSAAWNGLLAVDESYEGGELATFAEDGITFLHHMSPKSYQATIKAFSAPREFNPCIGDLEIKSGFILTRQQRTQFNFSYRTQQGDTGYKIHIIYNVLATPTARSYSTTNDTPDPVNLEWDIVATPVGAVNYRPTAHFIVDSTKTSSYALSILEDQLYGSIDSDAFLPLPIDIASYLLNDHPDVITSLILQTI